MIRRRDFLFGSLASVYYVACGSSGDDPLAPGAAPHPPDGTTTLPAAVDPVLKDKPLTATSAGADADRVFPQGLASGDPRPDRVILWTRLEPTGAKTSPNDDTEIEFVIAKDESLKEIVARGKVKAEAAVDHTLRVIPTGLEAGRAYYYRFEYAGTTTRVGRTRTAPSPDSDIPVRYAFCSCQDYIGRYYHSWQALLEEQAGLDFILFLGDYIYESVNDARFQTEDPARGIKLPDGIDTSPAQDGSRIAAATLADYRALYKAYRTDPLLKEVHRLYPFIITWDDHEFADDCWQDHSTSFNELDPKTRGFTAEQNTPRRRAANRAFSEYQPADITHDYDASFPNDIKIYRTVRWGKHVELFMTDQRMYRDDHLIPEGPLDIAVGKVEHNTSIGSRYFVRKSVYDTREVMKKPTILGSTQKAWFLDAITKSNATWKVWGNEVQMWQMQLRLSELPGVPGIFSYTVYVTCDQWDGYRSERAEIFDALGRANVQNLLVCTGDIHGFFAAELHKDFDAPTAKPVGVEYVTAGISSASLRVFVDKIVPPGSTLRSVAEAWASGADAALQSSNPHLRFANSNAYGFSLVDVDASRAKVTFVHLGDPTDKAYKGVVSKTTFTTKTGTNTILPGDV